VGRFESSFIDEGDREGKVFSAYIFSVRNEI
jgi:hypothetical protein